MREFLGEACGVVALVAVSVLTHLAFGDWRHRKGYKEGHFEGLKHADEWWLKTEKAVESEREKIWREEE